MDIRDLFPAPQKYQALLEAATDIEKDLYKLLITSLKRGYFGTYMSSYKLSSFSTSYFQVNPAKPLQDKRVERINEALENSAFEKVKQQFAEKAFEYVPSMIAPHIVAESFIKQLCALQLFSRERFHVLLLGDPGLGKTEIIRSASALHAVHAFGLGSGTSGVGLSVTIKGKQITPGLLPEAHEGICGLDELNLLPEKERASLYNAMEKGFITYNKGNNKVRMDAACRVLATANPKGDKFIGRDVKFLKQQIPFSDSLLSRFQVVCIMRQSKESFEKITRSIVRNTKQKENGDAEFMQRYIGEAEKISVDFPKKFEEDIVKWTTAMKEKEDKLLVDVSPRTVVGLVRIAQASARMHLRREVNKKDVKLACDLVEKSMTTF